MSDVKPFAFVLMPFDEEFDDLYKFGIKRTAESLGVVAERVDEQHFSESILERVYRQIENCDFVIADMTGRNANVFYEVGYAHAKGKKCALITQSAGDIPFDLKHHTHVIYDGSIGDLENKLSAKLAWLVDETKKAKQNSIAVKHRSGFGFLDRSEYRHTGSFELEVTLKNPSGARSPEIEAFYFITSRNWGLSIEKVACATDDFKDQNGRALRKHFVPANIRRLSPGAFAQIKPNLSHDFWTKWSGLEIAETYTSKGTIKMEVVTSEGTLNFDLPVNVEFDEIPF